MTTLAPPRIVCAAIRHRDGRIVCGPRHFDQTMANTLEQLPDPMDWHDAAQGFVDQFGNFLTRWAAWDIAEQRNQIVRCLDWFPGELHSEHLY